MYNNYIYSLSLEDGIVEYFESRDPIFKVSMVTQIDP